MVSSHSKYNSTLCALSIVSWVWYHSAHIWDIILPFHVLFLVFHTKWIPSQALQESSSKSFTAESFPSYNSFASVCLCPFYFSVLLLSALDPPLPYRFCPPLWIKLHGGNKLLGFSHFVFAEMSALPSVETDKYLWKGKDMKPGIYF